MSGATPHHPGAASHPARVRLAWRACAIVPGERWSRGAGTLDRRQIGRLWLAGVLLNYVDLLILAGIALYVVGVARRGFFAVSADLVVLVLSFVIALRLYGPAADALGALPGMSPVFARPVGFLAVLLIAQAALGIAANRLLDVIPYRWHTQLGSRLAAVVPAAAYGAVIAAAMVLILLALPLSPPLKDDVQGARLGGALLDRAVGVERAVGRIFGDAIHETLTFLTIQPEQGEAVQIQAQPDRLTVDAEAEAEMLRLVNEEREKQGVPPLTLDPMLMEVARAHSTDMWTRGYFSHTSPDGLSPFDRMSDAGVEFRFAGENLALAPTLEQAHRGLMESPGHRRNILDPTFTRIGIGVIDGGVRGLMFTQAFAD